MGVIKKGKAYGLVRLNLKLLGVALLCLALGAGALTALGAAEGEGVDVPVVMYHALLKDGARQGQYVVSPAQFESDLRYLQEHGYTTVLVKDLIAYTKGEDLPEKPVLITFDDGYYNNYLYGFPLAEKYGCKFVLSPIGRYSDLYTDTPDENAYYSHATWAQLREMAASGLVEVQNHSYDLHQSRGGRLGVKKLARESDQEYRRMLAQDLTRAQSAIEAGVGEAPTAFVYPFGAFSKATPDIVKGLGFACTMSCEERVSRITRDPESLYGLGRFLRPAGPSSQEFFEKRMGLGP